MRPVLEFLQRHWPTLATTAVLIVAAATFPAWRPAATNWLHSLTGRDATAGDTEHDEHDHDEHAHDDHGHAGHDETASIELSATARRNLGLVTGVVEPATFQKTTSIPAMVVERPGRSQVEITAHFTGIVTRVYPLEGQIVEPGEPLFELQLTHEDLVTAQRDFLLSAEELDVVEKELARLEGLGQGVIAGKTILEQKYQQQKLQAALHAQRQGLLLHGLAEDEVDSILDSRTLIHSLVVTTPGFADGDDHQHIEHEYHVQSLNVKRGQHVEAGATLAVLADHCLLYVEGWTFEDDARRLIQSADSSTPVRVSVVQGTDDGPPAAAEPASAASAGTEWLPVFYVADHVDPESRALRFYLLLENRVQRVLDRNGRKFISWTYRPGQRMEVQLPFGDPWQNQLVLPPAAVVDDGAESYLFEQNGDHFDRIPVHVIYRDRQAVVIENDGSLVGSTIALNGAYQLNLALRNKAGGGVDPHAGHNH